MRKAHNQLHNSRYNDYSNTKQKQFEGEMTVELNKKEDHDKKKSKVQEIKNF